MGAAYQLLMLDASKTLAATSGIPRPGTYGSSPEKLRAYGRWCLSQARALPDADWDAPIPDPEMVSVWRTYAEDCGLRRRLPGGTSLRWALAGILGYLVLSAVLHPDAAIWVLDSTWPLLAAGAGLVAVDEVLRHRLAVGPDAYFNVGDLASMWSR